MRSSIMMAVAGLAVLGLTTLAPSSARAQGVVVVGTPGVVVTPGTVYYPPVVVTPAYPPPVVVTPAPVVVTPAPVIIGGVRYVRPIHRPRVYVRIR